MRFPKYVPAGSSIGGDLRLMLSYSQSWFIADQSPYIGNNLYPPLATILFSPLLLVKFSWAYRLITVTNVLCYLIITLILPIQIFKEKHATSILMLVFITGLFSYGFQFELERGQFNIIAMTFCLLGIWIYHCRPKYRYFAYVLFIFSIQLKIYPLIFIFMFINDWRDWKNNLKRFFALIVVNFALFFVLGINVFVDFIDAIKAQTINPYIWIGNHSLLSFATWALTIASQHGLDWLNKYAVILQLALLAIILACLFFIIVKAYRKNGTGINSYLLIACTLGALLLPSVSHDYTLAILAAPIAILFCDLSFTSKMTLHLRQRLLSSGLTFILAFAYSVTLYSYDNKPILLQNNFPPLLIMLLAIVCLSVISFDLHRGRQPDSDAVIDISRANL